MNAMAEPWLEIFVRASWQAAVLACVVSALAFAFRDRITPRWKYLLWSVVLLRLVICVTPVAPWSLFQLFPAATQVAETVQPDPEASDRFPKAGADRSTPSLPAGAALPEPQPFEADTEPALAGFATNASAEARDLPGAPEPSPAYALQDRSFATPTAMLLMIWCVGCLLLAVRMSHAWWRLTRSLKHCRQVADPKLLELFAEAKAALGTRQHVALLVTAEPRSPFIVGLLVPKIVVPESMFDRLQPAQILHVLCHELAHLKRGDLGGQWLLLLGRLLHWFNPLAWWTVAKMKAAREAACDDLVVRRLGCSASDYGRTLLELAPLGPPPLAPGLIGMFRSRRQLTERIERLSRPTHYSGLSAVAGPPLVVALLLLGLTDAAPLTLNPQPPPQAADRDSRPAPTYEVSGVMLQRGDKLPAKGINIHLFKKTGPLGEPELIEATLTNEEGEFLFGGLQPPSEHHLKSVTYFTVIVPQQGAVQTNQWYVGFRDKTRFLLPGEAAVLRGRVLDPDGEPLPGAQVLPLKSHAGAVLGHCVAISDAEGLFEIDRLPLVVGLPDQQRQGRESMEFEVRADGFPTTKFKVKAIPGFAEFRLRRGCRLRGKVQDKSSGKGLAGKIVTALPMEVGGQPIHTQTDDQGVFDFRVTPGNYHVLLEDADVVAPAIADLECRAGRSHELPPFQAGPGGWIAGQLIHPETRRPVARSERGDLISVGLFGPMRPKQNFIPGAVVAQLNDQGEYRIRVAPGEHYPYLRNQQCDRMAWDTDKKPAVVVHEGQTTRCDLTVKVRQTGAQKMAAARKVYDALPADEAKRVQAIIEEYRRLNHTVDECETWCLLMRELIEIGPPAVPALCAELERTDEQRMMRRLGFALRAIGDKRAVPALIGAIPKTLQPAMSDYGLIVEDAELAAIMQKHDLDKNGRRGGKYFSFRRPVREIFGALHQLTEKRFDEGTFFSMHRRKDANSRRLQQERYHATAQKWKRWWENHWTQFGVDEAYREVKLEPLPELPPGGFPRGLELTANAEMDSGGSGWVLSPIGYEKQRTYFFDLDTGLTPDWPKNLDRKDRSADAIEAAVEHAKTKGVDLTCVAVDGADGKPQYVLRGIDMQLWELHPLDAKNIEKRVAGGSLPKGRVVGPYLAPYDPEQGPPRPKRGTNFLYLTREGGLGVITITDFVTQQQDITGMFSAPQGVGFHLGVKFNFQPIAR